MYIIVQSPFYIFILMAIVSILLLFKCKKHKYILIILTLLSVSLIFSAIYQPVLSLSEKTGKAVAIIDVSESISDGELSSALDELSSIVKNNQYDQFRYVVFADKPITIDPGNVSNRNIIDNRHSCTGAFSCVRQGYFAQTNINDAVLYAASKIDGCGDVYLFTDGVESRDKFNTNQFSKIFPGITLHVNILQDHSNAEVSLEKVDFLEQVNIGQETEAAILITSDMDCTGTIVITDAVSEAVARHDLHIENGSNHFNFPVVASTQVSKLVFSLEAKGCRIVNDTILKPMNALSKPKVSVFSNEETVYDNIKKLIGKYSDVKRVKNIHKIASSDLLIIQDNLFDIDLEDSIHIIKDELMQGMGVLILPSPYFFKDKVINNQDVKDILPVDIYQKNQNAVPTSAIAFVVDTSQSMRKDRLLIAKEVVRNTILNLSEQDMVGIVEFYGNRRWAAPMQPAKNTLEINRAINRLTSAGSTVLQPALLEAYYGLLNTDSSSKHIVIISDGGIENDNFTKEISRITKDKITLSTICVGDPLYASRMYDMSNLGRGVFYYSRDRFSIPVLSFESKYSSMGNVTGIDTSSVVVGVPHSIMNNTADSGFRLSTNYYYSKAKPDSQTLLLDNSNNPVLSIRHYGLGRVAFCSADVFSFSNKDTSTLFQNLCRQLYKQKEADKMQYAQLGDKLEIYYNMNTDLEYSINRPKAIVMSDDTVVDESVLRMALDGSKRLYAEFSGLDSGFYTIDIRDRSNNQLGSIVCSFNTHCDGNRMSGNSTFSSELRLHGDTAANPINLIKHIELWPAFILSALLVFMYGIYYRRKNADTLNILILVISIILLAGNGYADEIIYPNQDVISRDLGISQSDSQAIGAFLSGNFQAAAELECSELGKDRPLKTLIAMANYQCGNYARSTELFSQMLADDPEYYFGKMILAWTILSAEKSGESDTIINEIVGSENLKAKYSEMIAISFILEKQYKSFIAFYKDQRDESLSDISNRKFWDQQLLAAYLISGNELHIEMKKAFSDIKLNVMFLARFAIMSGERENARQMLDSFINTTAEPDIILSIAYFATRYSLFSTAEKAAKKVMQVDDRAGYQAAMLCVDALIAQNKKAELIEILKYLLASDKTSYSQQAEIAMIYHNVQEPGMALSLLENIYKETSEIQYLIAIAMFYEKEHDLEKAYKTWYKVWNLSNDGESVSAETKLLDLARRSGNIPELIVELEYEYEKSKQANTFYLLMSIYLSIEDSISITDLIEQYYGNDTLEALKVKHQAYLLCNEFNLCEQVLLQLTERDEDNYDLYIRKLGVLAAVRGDSSAINYVSRELKVFPADNLVQVYQQSSTASMMGDYELSMALLQAKLDDYPDNGELLLSWVNAAIAADKKSMAMARVKEILHSDPDIILLTYAIDSILNIKASGEDLEEALAVVFRYICQEPEDVMLYYLALDIVEALGQYEKISNIVLTAMVYAPDRCYQLTRHALRFAEISETLRIDLSRSLIITNCKLSSIDYNDICMSLLNNDMYYEAEYVLKCYLSDTYDPQVYIDVAEYYHNAGLYDRSHAIIQEALTYSPDNYELLLINANSYFAGGDYEKAFKLYQGIYLNYSASIAGDTQALGVAKVDVLRQKILNGMIYSSSDIDTDIISPIENDIHSHWNNRFDNLIYNRIKQQILDIIYVCSQTSRYDHARSLATKLKNISNNSDSRFEIFIDSILEQLLNLEGSSIPAALDNSSELFRLSNYAINYKEMKDILNRYAIEQNPDVVLMAAKSFLKNMQLNGSIDVKLIKQFYYTLWIKLTDDQHKEFAEILSTINKYDNNHYVILLKFESGVLKLYPDELISRSIISTPDPDTCAYEILCCSGSSKQQAKVIDEFLKCQAEWKLLPVFKLIGYLGKNIDGELASIIERKLSTYSFVIKDPGSGFRDNVIYYQKAMVNKELSLMLIDKLINDFPEAPVFHIMKMKFFPHLYKFDEYCSNISDLVKVIVGSMEIEINYSDMLETLISLMPRNRLSLIISGLEQVSSEKNAAKQYVNSLVYYAQDDYENAQAASSFAYTAEPDNSMYRKNLVKMFECTGDYVLLADILKSSQKASSASSYIVYHDIVGYYCQSGCFDDALESVKNVHSKLRNFDYLLVYDLMSNNELMLRYFRESFSKQSLSSFVFSRPKWMREAGLADWRQDNELSFSFEDKLIYKLAENDKYADDLRRFWLTVPTNKDIAMTYAQAYARSITGKDLLNKTLSDLYHKYQNNSLSIKDDFLIFALFYHKLCPDSEFVSMVNHSIEIVKASFPNENLLISQAYYNNANYDKAIKYAQMRVASSVFGLDNNVIYLPLHEAISRLADLHESSSARIEVSLDILDGALKLYPEDAIVLAAKFRLLNLAKMSSAADKIFLNLSNRVKNGEVFNHKLVDECLRYCVRKSDLEAFESIFSDLISRPQFIDDEQIDYVYIFSDKPENIALFSDFIANTIGKQLEKNKIRKSSALRNYSLLAISVYGKSPQAAASYLDSAMDLQEFPALNDLWLADAYYHCNDIERARKIEGRLAEINKLPYRRGKRLSEDKLSIMN